MAGAGGGDSGNADPFATATLRDAVLAAWRDSPTRFREDANAEEDLVRGGYRDRLVVELAQNAADAALRAGVPGRLLLRLREGRLEASNTGAALDADGVASLASLRASAKRGGGDTVGRFGVGFASVVAVSDSPAVRSTGGGVRFSADDTRTLAAAEPRLTDEVTRRAGQVPVLRLPFPEPGAPEPGFTTTVVLPIRDDAALRAVHQLLDDVDDALLLSLPALREVVIETGAHHRRRLTAEAHGRDVVVHDDGRRSRWRVASTQGAASPDVLRDRPVEERSRPGWSVTWAVSLDDDGRPAPLPATAPGVLHAPTPTDEPLALPALLVASFPLDPTRRHVAPGPLADLLTVEAAAAYAALVAELADDVGPAALSLVPGPAPAGALDGRVREAVLGQLRGTPLLRAQGPAGRRLLPADAVVLDPAPAGAVAALGAVFDGLVAADWSHDLRAVERLGARLLPLPDALDALADLVRTPAWWRELYQALTGLEPHLLEGLPVPLVDGRTVRGPRSALLPGTAVPPGDLAALGLRVVHPDAVHPLLARLGAVEAEPSGVLADPRLLARLPDADDALVGAVLRTAAGSGLIPGQVPGLALLPVPTSGGGRAAAGETVLPGSLLAEVRDREVPLVDADLVAEVGTEALTAVGVLDRLRVARLADVEVDPGRDDLGADSAGWAEYVLDAVADAGGDASLPPLAAEVAVVVGLDVVAEDAWGHGLPLLVDPEVRRALVDRVTVHPADGPPVTVSSPGAWWLREARLLDGAPPITCRSDDAEPVLSGVYPQVASASVLDAALLEAVGVRPTVAALLGDVEGPSQLLDRLADPDLEVAADQVVQLYRALAELPESRWPEPLDVVRVPAGAASAVVAVEEATVVVAPHHLALAGPSALPGTPRVAELLDVAASDRLATADPTGGHEVPVPPAVADLLPGAAASYREHDELVVAGCAVDWWVGQDGVVHAATTHGLARGLAWQADQWDRRWEVEAVLADPDRAHQAAAERPFDAR